MARADSRQEFLLTGQSIGDSLLRSSLTGKEGKRGRRENSEKIRERAKRNNENTMDYPISKKL